MDASKSQARLIHLDHKNTVLFQPNLSTIVQIIEKTIKLNTFKQTLCVPEGPMF